MVIVLLVLFEFFLNIIDCYLIVFEILGIVLFIVLNKIDLFSLEF